MSWFADLFSDCSSKLERDYMEPANKNSIKLLKDIPSNAGSNSCSLLCVE